MDRKSISKTHDAKYSDSVYENQITLPSNAAPSSSTSEEIKFENAFKTTGTLQPTKVCEGCRVEKSESEFYIKAPGRFDNQCKECRKISRKNRYKAITKPIGSSEEFSPQEKIKNFLEVNPDEYSQKEPKLPRIEPHAENDFSIWEEKYGRTLSEAEKLEIKSNMTELFLILLEIAEKEGVPNGRKTI